MEIEILEFIEPTENNRYCVFDEQLEDDDNVFFHMTSATKKEAIIDNGFKSANELGIGELTSVSYAKRSSGCFSNLGSGFEDEQVVFAVRFQPEDLQEIAINTSDIHVYKKHLQPEILYVTHIPAGFQLS